MILFLDRSKKVRLTRESKMPSGREGIALMCRESSPKLSSPSNRPLGMDLSWLSLSSSLCKLGRFWKVPTDSFSNEAPEMSKSLNLSKLSKAPGSTVLILLPMNKILIRLGMYLKAPLLIEVMLVCTKIISETKGFAVFGISLTSFFVPL